CELHPRSGRTHQLRVHMAHIGCPLLGDWLYGESSPLIARPALHAERVAFTHPLTGEYICVHAPMPKDMSKLLNA
ncbi:MAG: RluA family pseudouridine synthase, partial [Eubacteriales bacterium]|nr:RluA family pseudouridine synthase [Christensenellaceae bacterium]MDY5719159.1 RluA family pseudouridine synthase [Eubacteriales bacterium]